MSENEEETLRCQIKQLQEEIQTSRTIQTKQNMSWKNQQSKLMKETNEISKTVKRPPFHQESKVKMWRSWTYQDTAKIFLT